MTTKLILSMAFITLCIASGSVHAKESKRAYKLPSLKTKVALQEQEQEPTKQPALLAQAETLQTTPPTEGNVI